MPPSKPSRASEYFAALPTGSEDFGKRVSSRLQTYRDAKAVRDVHYRIEKAYQYHFGLSPAGLHVTSGVTRGGEQGELAEVHVPHLRANSLTVLNLTVAPKITWKPVATNSDSASVKQSFNAEALLDYYWLVREVGHFAVQAVAHCIPLSEGFVFTPWEEALGEVLAVAPGVPTPENPNPEPVPQTSGDFALYNVLPWDVVRDPSKKSWDQNQWVAVCLWQNRYELAAKYPDHENEIIDASSDDASQRREVFGESDDVQCWYFYHRKCAIPELRKGREAVLLADGTVLADGVLTYDDIPLHRVVPDEFFGTPYGYTQYHEGIGIQEASDSLTSAILTNQDAFARQMIAVEMGQPFSPEDIGGCKVLYYSNKKPEALQLTSSPAEAFKFVDILKQDLRRIQGVNDAVQGQLPGDSKLSGAALALLSSQAIQQNSTLQANYVRMARSIGNCLLREWAKRTPLPRKIQLVGKSNEFMCREQSLSGEDVKSIKEVNVDIGNPLNQTHAGKMEIAQMLLNIPGAITSPEQIDMLITTGKLEHLTRGTRDELILILDENEKIAEGIAPPVMIQDNHLQHGREHRSTTASVSSRENPAIVQAAIDHIHEHYKVFFGWPNPMLPPAPPPLDPMTGMPDPTYDPTSPVNDPMYRENMLLLVGQQAPPNPAMLGGAMGGLPVAPPGEGGAPPPVPPGANPPKPPELPGNNTNLPSMPTNPGTGEKYSTPGGQGTVPQ